ncbi:MAG: hypothetical protein OJF59_001011 [Cytophagales bacterium]|jgi:hypothetical protein|nr:hypothetical protein [Bacteroidota bacterium]MBS1979994.1 hypothetical protein [Bacteroidota bacterium]WHZ07258.1 MAG: hypothetical protein OJF59_001011 [Cytophagales bacterium]
MISYLKKIRQEATLENKIIKYVLYATGEILLVVIGILIALQINNRNDQKKERANELRYLSNLRTDLSINITEIDRYITARKGYIDSARLILEYFDGKPIHDANNFLLLGLPIYNWQRFYQTNNTFQELTSSGNLALISNDTIKTLLYNIDRQHKINKAEEDHFRFDTEVLIYEPIYQLLDIKAGLDGIGIQLSKSKQKKIILPNDYNAFLKSNKLKNGFAMVVLEFGTLNGQLAAIKKMSEQLIDVIDREIKKG